MPASQTGVVTQNNFDDPRMWGKLNREFLYGASGSGIAIGDYDGDGRPDIFVASKTDGCRLFRNLGGWRFEDVTSTSGVGGAGGADQPWEGGVTFVDINNDGRLDIYVCRFNAPNLLYMNQGDGTFREEAGRRGIDLADGSVMANFCDYDGDGWLDAFIVTNATDYTETLGRPDRLFHNNGDGTFREVTPQSGIKFTVDQGHSAAWWDYNNDGRPDLYVANDFDPPDFLYRNDGNGRFTDQLDVLLPHTPNSSMGSDTGDLNNDGRIDLVVADMEPMTHEKDQRTLANSRVASWTKPGDPLTAHQIPRNAVFLNTGTSRGLEIAELAGLAATGWTWSVRCEDLDCDGRVDLHFTTGMVRELHNADLRARIHSAGSLLEQTQILKNSPVLSERNLAYRNEGELKFEEVGATWGLDEDGVSFGAAFGDLDGDGDLDLVYTNYKKGVTVLRNDCDTGHRVVMHLRGTASNRFGIGGTVKIETTAGVQVRSLQLARGYMSSSEPIVHFGLGDAARIDRCTITWPSGRVQELTNLAADRSYTITEPDDAKIPAPEPEKRLQFRDVAQFAGLAFTAREQPFDEWIQQPLLPHTFNRCGPAVAVGDLNGDGTDDVVIGGTTLDAPRLLVADRQGDYNDSGALAAFANTQVNDGPVLVFDADADGRNDILITSGGVAAPAGSPVYQPRLLLNQGDAKFTRSNSLLALLSPIGAAAAADFDRDGRLDVFLGSRVSICEYPLPGKSALWRNTGGTFEDVTDTVAPGLRSVGLVTSAIWSDADSDGWVDLIVALEWGSIHYFHNEHGKLVDHSDQTGFASPGIGLWTSLASCDFNGDGRPDFVAGNLGLNMPYRAPVELYRGDFGGNGPLTIEGYHEDDLLYPRVPRSELGAALPLVLRRFQRTDDYAKATLPQILGEDRLATAQHWSATQLQSGIFLSNANGIFTFVPLPRIAQVAPMQGMAALDFDGDGHADIVAVQNAYTFSQNVGRFDGGIGQFLKGDGKGNFTPVEPADCGLGVPGDARSLALIDFDDDSWPDFVVTRSRSVSMGWQNRGNPANRTLEIRLRGAKGNPNAIGSAVTATLADGSTQTSEVAAGSGVLSQSTSRLYFGYPANIPPRSIRVRWPDGSTSTQTISSVPEVLSIDQRQH